MESGISLNCKNCGGSMTAIGNNVYKCQWCGSEMLVPDTGHDFNIVSAELDQYAGASQHVIIPPSTAVVGRGAFKDRTALLSVTLPDSVTRIEDEAFAGCINLKTIVFPRDLTYIGDRAFMGSGLTHITIYNKLDHIGIGAFMECPFLEEVVFSGEVPRKAEKVFKKCARLSTVEIDLKGFSLSFKPSMEARKEGNPLPTFFDYFQGTPFFAELQQKYANKICVLCGGSIGRKRTCERCGAKYYDKRGCYIATCVYGSYDCPEVWTLRRYRDDTLAATWYGRLFIRAYYAISPTLVKWFGNTKWFKKLWQGKLDRMVKKLQANGVESTPYQDKIW